MNMLARNHLQQERSQARARLGYVLLGCAYFGALASLSPHAADHRTWIALLLLADLAYVAGQLLVLPRLRHFSPRRQIVSIAVDMISISMVMAMAGKWGAVFYPLYLWVIGGNGTRFGVRYLWMAMGMGATGFALAIMGSGYWQANMPAAMGLLFGMIVLPLFHAVLIKRLHELNRQLRDECRNAEHMAGHDAMTGLANRLRFECRLDSEIERAQRGGLCFSVYFIDLNGFKAVNDSLGHKAGDRLLCHVAAQIGEAVRSTDMAARLGGDEFAVISAAGAAGSQPDKMVDRLVAAVGKPCRIDGKAVAVGASIGMASFPEDGEDSESIMHAADEEMYAHKHGDRASRRRAAETLVVHADGI